MTEQLRNEQPRDRRNRNAGLGAAAGLTILLVGAGIGAAVSGGKTEAAQSPAATLATPRSSEAGASPSPEVSKAPEVQIQNFTVEKLGTFDVLPGDIIAGDISMSDTKDSAIFPLYDQDTHKAADVKDNTKTALFVEIQAPGVIHAEWGATVTRGLTAEKKAEMLKLQAISKQRAGFERVDVVIWSGYNTTTDEAGFKADGTAGSITSANPSESPIPGSTNLDGLDKQAKIKVILNLFAQGKIDPNSQEGKVLLDVIVSCLCGCTTPAETPKPTSTPTPTSEICVPMYDNFMKAGETYEAFGKKFIVQGDVIIDGVTYFDNSDKTGAIDMVSDGKKHTIKAPYGADVQVFNSCATDQLIQDTYKHDLEQLNGTGRTLDTKSIKK